MPNPTTVRPRKVSVRLVAGILLAAFCAFCIGARAAPPIPVRIGLDAEFGLVLLYIGLPDMRGYELARALKEMPSCADTALGGVSGYGQAQDRRMSQEAGFAAHLVKPVGTQELIETIGRVQTAGA